MWHDILVALALMLVIEGILPFLNPTGIRKALIMMAQMDDRQLRFGGLSSMIIGVIVLYLIN
ncbi:MAG: DUF2065 domain-containing protein [Gammaproteobacteria bacterium]|jgi:uncharacterized protein YjeT (DUF2065 family)|nr:DUF2065 domain-containing protein [Gammaproteobacteria bacterium]